MDKSVQRLSVKIRELEAQLEKLSRILFSYHMATMKYLETKGLVDPKDAQRPHVILSLICEIKDC